VPDIYDIAIVGGGINGCGTARDAAGRGYSVFLCEMDDLGSGTSSRSTKLIHGGLRYLEHFEFRLVRESLIEREVLWNIAPHIIRPMRFVLPYRRDLRPAWMLRAGLFLYDHLGGRKQLPATRMLDLEADSAGRPLKSGLFTRGFEYSDCWVDDARLVVLNARDAADRGAVIRTRARMVSASRIGGFWRLQVEGRKTGARETIQARTLINAAGPWVADVLQTAKVSARSARVRLVQGAHIVVRKLFDHERAYIFQNPDGRIVFAIPYEGAFTLIGTTDRDYSGDPACAVATAEEIDYLCATASASFAQPITPSQVVWSYAGVRPLHDDGSHDAKAATRDYTFDLNVADGEAPLLSAIGGKITTYRRLAEQALERLQPYLPAASGSPAGWTADKPLPGGTFPPEALNSLVEELARRHPFLARSHAERLVRSYGTLATAVLGDASSLQDLGRNFGATLTEREVRYLIDREWAQTAEDVVWRRSKLGLYLSQAELASLETWMRDAGPKVDAEASLEG
jgi:glycerol-3-phosphate dehydrogenase